MASDYEEYYDDGFLNVLGLGGLKDDLADFWPKGGPHWDGLGRFTNHESRTCVVLLEAKSHVKEGNSSCGAKDPESIKKISSSLERVKRALNVPVEADWMNGQYQLANRIAHLYFLERQCGVPTWLVYVYFIGDSTVTGSPLSVNGWLMEIARMRARLQLGADHALSHKMVDVFFHLGG